jgi:DNA-binding MurR/RpiR family transcriptional regulator
MSDVQKILRLMNHAADLLEAQEDPLSEALGQAAADTTSGAKQREYMGVGSSAAVAIGLAQNTLRLVAAFLTETDVAPTDGSQS